MRRHEKRCNCIISCEIVNFTSVIDLVISNNCCTFYFELISYSECLYYYSFPIQSHQASGCFDDQCGSLLVEYLITMQVARARFPTSAHF